MPQDENNGRHDSDFTKEPEDSLEALKFKYLALQADLDLMVGQDLSARFLRTYPRDLSAAQVTDLRTYYKAAQAQIERFLELRKNFGQVRTTITTLATFLSILFLFVITYHFYEEVKNPAGGKYMFAVSLIMICGMLGGCVSALSRLYSLKWNEAFVIEASNKNRMFVDLFLNFIQSILLGAIFSIILYLAFAGNFIQGQLFPSFRPEGTEFRPGMPNPSDLHLFHYFLEFGPTSHASYAKALLWAFAAGFSERLVPDFLSTLTPSANNALASRTKVG